MNSKMRNVIKKHRKAKKRLAALRKEGLAKAALKPRRGRKPKSLSDKQVLTSYTENAGNTNDQ